MKLVYIVQEDSGNFIKGVFHNVNNAIQCALDQPTEDVFNIIECPINKSIDNGILTHAVMPYHTSLPEVLDVNPVYTSGGIKKWSKDQKKQRGIK